MKVVLPQAPNKLVTARKFTMPRWYDFYGWANQFVNDPVYKQVIANNDSAGLAIYLSSSVNQT
jgi:hypothetical protein